MDCLTGDIRTPTGVVHFPPENFTAFNRNSETDISHHLEIKPSNQEFLQEKHPGGDSFLHFSNPDQYIHLLDWDGDLGYQHEPFNVNKFIDQNNDRDGSATANANGSPALLQVRTNTKPEHRDMTSRPRFWETELSSSDDDCEVSEASEGDLDQEERRVKMTKLKVFLQNLISQVMQKQEQMHKQLIDMVEKKEKERISVEEAWKKQEIERAKVDEEERKQETLRSLALISFIKKWFYHETERLYSPESSNCGDNSTGTQNHNCLKDGSNNKRWAKTEVQALITVRVAVEQKFLVKGAKGSGWKEVAAGLSNMGYNRSPEKCREKWENINKYYRRTMEGGKKRQRSLPYFEELDLIYKRGLLSHGNASS